MPWTEMSDQEVAVVLRVVAIMAENGYAEDGPLHELDAVPERLRIKADLLDPPPIKADDTVRASGFADDFRVVHVDDRFAWVVSLQSDSGDGGWLVGVEALTIVSRAP